MTYRWVDHTSELELELEGRTEADVFAAGLAAVAGLLAEEPHGETERRDVIVTAPDRARLLADWLGELVYLVETDEFLPDRVAALELEGERLRATVEGRRASPRNLVKGVTYHRLELAREDSVWRARVVLDV